MITLTPQMKAAITRKLNSTNCTRGMVVATVRDQFAKVMPREQAKHAARKWVSARSLQLGREAQAAQ